MVNNPLVFYFEKLKDDYNLKTYEDIAKYLDISIGTIKNAYGLRTVFPSKRLTKHLSERFNKKPEDVLNDIYNNSFCEPCKEYLKIVTLSLFYNFGYSLFYNDNKFIQFYQIPLPVVADHRVCSFAKIRNNGPERKYTLILDWSSINRALVDWCEHTQNFLVKSGCILMAMSNLYYRICTDEFDDIKRMIVVFASDEEEDYQLFRKMCNDSKHRVLPLLYDDNAEYSIRDVDMLNGIR